MLMACFDLEGVFLPEIWIEVSKITGIQELSLTTRDIKDYDELMTRRLSVLKEHSIGIKDIRDVISKISPVEGAKEFLDWARSVCQVTILSDTFYEFADPLMAQLGRPALFCHNLVVENGMIVGYRLRLKDPKTKAVHRFKELNFETFATGDSYNDTGMIQAADHACFFRAPKNVLADFPAYKGYTEFAELKTLLSNLINKKD
jgi:phosphoserine / homoserine phosphotransferase